MPRSQFTICPGVTALIVTAGCDEDTPGRFAQIISRLPSAQGDKVDARVGNDDCATRPAPRVRNDHFLPPLLLEPVYAVRPREHQVVTVPFLFGLHTLLECAQVHWDIGHRWRCGSNLNGNLRVITLNDGTDVPAGLGCKLPNRDLIGLVYCKKMLRRLDERSILVNPCLGQFITQRAHPGIGTGLEPLQNHVGITPSPQPVTHQVPERPVGISCSLARGRSQTEFEGLCNQRSAIHPARIQSFSLHDDETGHICTQHLDDVISLGPKVPIELTTIQGLPMGQERIDPPKQVV